MVSMSVESMPKKDKPKRDDKSAKLERILVERAQIIARTRGLSLAEYLSDLVRPGIKRDWPGALKKLDSSGPPTEDE